MTDYAVRVAKTLGVSQTSMQTLRHASRLHDIGKLGINDATLHKNEDLSDDERGMIREHPPDIILLDVEMPRMDGYEFAGRVRNNPDTASLPIIMVTSRTGEKHRARAIELGVNDYLGKPYQEPEMLEAIRHILGDDFNVGENVRDHDVVS